MKKTKENQRMIEKNDKKMQKRKNAEQNEAEINKKERGG